MEYVVLMLLMTTILLLSLFNTLTYEGRTKLKYTLMNWFIMYLINVLRISGFDDYSSFIPGCKKVKWNNTPFYIIMYVLVNNICLT